MNKLDQIQICFLCIANVLLILLYVLTTIIKCNCTVKELKDDNG